MSLSPRPELRNAAIEITRGENAVRCMARRGYPWAMVAMAVFLAVLCLSPIVMLLLGLADRRSLFDAIAPAVAMMIPLLGAMVVLLVMIRRSRQPLGVEIADGTVTLHTADSTLPQHVFDLRELKGATLTGRGHTSTLRIDRRKGMSIAVFIGYRTGDLSAAMDAINRMVIHDRVHGFEVIPTAQVVSVLPPMEGEGI